MPHVGACRKVLPPLACRHARWRAFDAVIMINVLLTKSKTLHPPVLTLPEAAWYNSSVLG